MRQGRPSQTAAIVALMRALADAGMTSVPGFRDSTARVLLPGMWSLAARTAERLVPAAGRRFIARAIDPLPLRTFAIDAQVRAAVAAGIDQVVILGAGLDGRAYRMPELQRASVFEVDHPAT